MNTFEHYAAGEALYYSMVEPVCAKHGLTYMQFTVLMFLANNPEYDTAAKIVKYRRLTKSHVSISVRGLRERGLLGGTTLDADRRTMRLCVTESAAAIVEDGRAAQRSFASALFSGFSRDEYELLTGMMARIDRNIEDHIREHKEGRLTTHDAAKE